MPRTNALLALSLLFLESAAAQSGSVQVQLTPHPSVQGTTQVISFGVPLPPGLLTNTALVRVRNTGGAEVPVFVRSLGPWRSGHTGIRSVLVQFQALVPDTPWQVTVDIGVARTQSRPSETLIRSTWRLAAEGTYSAADGVWEPSVYATLPADWLAAAGLMPLASVSGQYPFLKTPIDDPMEQYWPHLVNQFNPFPASSELIKYLTDYEPWLYDRAQSFFQLYARTGRQDALREAHRAVQHYQSQLYTMADCPSNGQCVGQFKMRVPTPFSLVDAKYSYTAPLATDYWLTGDPVVLQKIPDASTGAVSQAIPGSFFTQSDQFAERNFGAALTGLAHDFDVTGNTTARTRATDVLNTLEGMQNVPPNGLPSNGCFHYRPEEANGAWGFSPWMSTLLGHGLYRAWETFGETRAKTILGRLAQCVADRGVAEPYATSSPLWWYSRYLGTSSGPLEFSPGDPWADGEHSVDVAYLMALGAWAVNPGPARDRLVLMAHRLLHSQQLSLGRWYQPTNWPGNGFALYRVNPPRKYAWWYTQSPGIGRLLGDGPADLAAVGVAMSPAQGGMNLDGDVALHGPASAGGSTVTLLSSRTDLVTVPSSVFVDPDQAYATFPMVTAPVAASTNVTLTAILNGVSKTVTLTLLPPTIARLNRAAGTVGGGSTTSATVELKGPAPDGGLVVNLSNGNPGLITIPPTVSVPAGALTANFSIPTSTVASTQTVTYSASLGSSSASAGFSLVPVSLSRVTAPTTMTRGVTVTTASVGLTGPAPTGGVTVTLSSSDASSLSVPASVTVPQGSTSATFTVNAVASGSATPVTITATANSVVRTTVVALQTGVLSSLVLRPPTMVGGATTSNHILVLTSAAPPGGVTVPLLSSDPTSLTVPATVVVAAGTTSKTFSVTAASTASTREVAVTATAGGETRGMTMVISPNQATALTGLTLAQSSVGGGSVLAGNTVQIGAPAPPGGLPILLDSSDASAAVPANVVIPAGQTTTSFSITTTAVSSPKSAVIRARLGTQSRTATLTVMAVYPLSVTVKTLGMAGGVDYTGNTVKLSRLAPAGGTVVGLSSSKPEVATVPASVTVPEGLDTASFTITTSPVDVQTPVAITAQAGGGTATNSNGYVKPPAVTGVLLAMTTTEPGKSFTTNRVSLNTKAPDAGFAVALSSSDPAHVVVPASVTVPGGATVGYFPVTIAGNTPAGTYVVTAARDGMTKTDSFEVTGATGGVLTALSVSPATPVGGTTTTANKVTISAAAPPAGTVVVLSSSVPALASVPASVIVPDGQTFVTFSIVTAPVAAPQAATITASFGGVTKTATVTAQPAKLSGVSVYPSSLIGGRSTTQSKVSLNGMAAAGGLAVQLTSSDPALVQVPATVVVPEGELNVIYTAVTQPVGVATPVTVSATAGGIVKTAVLTVQPPTLNAITASPTTVAANSVTGGHLVKLTGAAAAPGFVVTLSSSNPAVLAVPASVIVPAGATQMGVTMTAGAPSALTSVTVTATSGTISKTVIVKVLSP